MKRNECSGSPLGFLIFISFLVIVLVLAVTAVVRYQQGESRNRRNCENQGGIYISTDEESMCLKSERYPIPDAS